MVRKTFLDHKMPGISGIEFLREAKPMAPVIALTAFAVSPIPSSPSLEHSNTPDPLDLLNWHIMLSTAYSHLFAGYYLRDTGKQDVRFMAVWLNYRF